MGAIRESKEAVQQGKADVKTAVSGKQHHTPQQQAATPQKPPTRRQRNAANHPPFSSQIGSLAAQAVSDIRQTSHEVFFGQSEHPADPAMTQANAHDASKEGMGAGVHGSPAQPVNKPQASSHQQALADAAKRGSNRANKKGRTR